MNRRNIFATLLAATGLAAAAKASAAAEPPAGVPKVVYHLADAEKADFVLGNIRNHIDGMGGPDKVIIALVVHGPALRLFEATSTNVDLRARLANASAAGVSLHACANTMAHMKITLKDLLPGFILADKGGVVRLADLQREGYVYLRP